jgi:hypothetical protein
MVLVEAQGFTSLLARSVLVLAPWFYVLLYPEAVKGRGKTRSCFLVS